MPLARARCTACSEPLGDPPHVPLPMRCAACSEQTLIAMGADGQPADFDAAFTPMDLLRWFAFARAGMARGQPGIAVGACKRCRAPLVLSSRQPLSLPCPHCRTPVSGEAAQVLVDQWPEPWSRIEGGGISLEYRLAVVDDSTGITAGCATCGLPTPPNDPATQCARCGQVTWAARETPDTSKRPQRTQLGVRVDGTRNGRPFNQLVAIAQAEAMLRNDAAIGTSAESGKSMLGLTGIGCAIAIGLAVLTIFGLTIGIYFATKH
jgi:hypothetical protein